MEVLTVTYKGRTVIVQDADKEVIAAGSPRAVALTLKALFLQALEGREV